MSQVLQYSPGQIVTIIFEQLLDSGPNDGYRSDGYNIGFGPPDGYGVDGYYSLPIISRIILPSLSEVAGYPKKMTRIDVGLYYFQFTLPIGSPAIGSYIVDITYINPNTENYAQTFYQVICAAPFGQYSVTTF